MPLRKKEGAALTPPPPRPAPHPSLQLVMAQREPGESLREVCQMLRRNPEAEGMLGVMRKWGTKNGIKGL